MKPYSLRVDKTGWILMEKELKINYSMLDVEANNGPAMAIGATAPCEPVVGLNVAS